MTTNTSCSSLVSSTTTTRVSKTILQPCGHSKIEDPIISTNDWIYQKKQHRKSPIPHRALSPGNDDLIGMCWFKIESNKSHGSSSTYGGPNSTIKVLGGGGYESGNRSGICSLPSILPSQAHIIKDSSCPKVINYLSAISLSKTVRDYGFGIISSSSSSCLDSSSVQSHSSSNISSPNEYDFDNINSNSNINNNSANDNETFIFDFNSNGRNGSGIGGSSSSNSSNSTGRSTNSTNSTNTTNKGTN